jgi:hypothetical protein
VAADGVLGQNYSVSNADGEASSLLQLDMYALNGDARDGSYVDVESLRVWTRPASTVVGGFVPPPPPPARFTVCS